MGANGEGGRETSNVQRSTFKLGKWEEEERSLAGARDDGTGVEFGKCIGLFHAADGLGVEGVADAFAYEDAEEHDDEDGGRGVQR